MCCTKLTNISRPGIVVPVPVDRLERYSESTLRFGYSRTCIITQNPIGVSGIIFRRVLA